MLYASYEDVINLGGFQPQDLFELGYEMTPEQLRNYVEGLIATATDLINRYCNVDTFEVHEIEDEFHTLDIGDSFTPIYGMVRGFPGLSYSCNLYDYTTDLNKFTIIPREQPVRDVTKVMINNSWAYAKPNWVEIRPYTIDDEGDYRVTERYNTTRIVFVHRFPCPSVDNVRITYTAGYPEDHPMWETMKLCCAMICNNILMAKKKNQEAVTIRGAGIPDYSTMFNSGYVFTHEIKMLLDLYRKDPMAAFSST